MDVAESPGWPNPSLELPCVINDEWLCHSLSGFGYRITVVHVISKPPEAGVLCGYLTATPNIVI